jgi:hypothetical protein
MASVWPDVLRTTTRGTATSFAHPHRQQQQSPHHQLCFWLTTSPMSHQSQDIIEELIQHVDNPKTLRTCTYVCNSFRHTAQKYLFQQSLIKLCSYDGRRTAALKYTLERNPVLTQHVFYLEISLNTLTDGTPLFAELLHAFTRIRSIKLVGYSGCLWKSPWSVMFQDALFQAFERQSLREVTLNGDALNFLVANPRACRSVWDIESLSLNFFPLTGRSIGFDELFTGKVAPVQLPRLRTVRISDIMYGTDVKLCQNILCVFSNSIQHLYLSIRPVNYGSAFDVNIMSLALTHRSFQQLIGCYSDYLRSRNCTLSISCYSIHR